MIASLPAGTTLQSRFLALMRASASRPPGWDALNFGAGIADARQLLELGLELAQPEMASATRQERSWATMIRDSLARIELNGPEAAAPLLPDRLLERHGTELVWLGLSRRMAPRRPGPESDFAVPSRSRALDRRLAELAGQAPVTAAAGPPPAAPRAPGMAAGRIARTPGLIAAGRRLPGGRR